MATVARSWKLMIGGAKVTRPLSVASRQPAMVWHIRPSVMEVHTHDTCTHTHLVPALIDDTTAWLRTTTGVRPLPIMRLAETELLSPHSKERQKNVYILPALSLPSGWLQQPSLSLHPSRRTPGEERVIIRHAALQQTGGVWPIYLRFTVGSGSSGASTSRPLSEKKDLPEAIPMPFTVPHLITTGSCYDLQYLISIALFMPPKGGDVLADQSPQRGKVFTAERQPC